MAHISRIWAVNVVNCFGTSADTDEVTTKRHTARSVSRLLSGRSEMSGVFDSSARWAAAPMLLVAFGSNGENDVSWIDGRVTFVAVTTVLAVGVLAVAGSVRWGVAPQDTRLFNRRVLGGLAAGSLVIGLLVALAVGDPNQRPCPDDFSGCEGDILTAIVLGMLQTVTLVALPVVIASIARWRDAARWAALGSAIVISGVLILNGDWGLFDEPYRLGGLIFVAGWVTLPVSSPVEHGFRAAALATFIVVGEGASYQWDPWILLFAIPSLGIAVALDRVTQLLTGRISKLLRVG